MNSVEVVEIKTDKKRLMFTIQLVCAVLLIIFGIVSLFRNEFDTWVYLIVFINMVILAINNYLFLKNKKMISLYIIVGIFFLVKFIMGLL